MNKLLLAVVALATLAVACGGQNGDVAPSLEQRYYGSCAVGTGWISSQAEATRLLGAACAETVDALRTDSYCVHPCGESAEGALEWCPMNECTADCPTMMIAFAPDGSVKYCDRPGEHSRP